MALLSVDDASLFATTQALMAIDSTTGREADASAWLTRYLADKAYDVTRQAVGGDDMRANVYARFGKPEVVLTTHMDCVPPFVSPSETATRHVGRGACDAKGIIAAMIEAGEALKRKSVRDFGLLFVVAEETDSLGAKTFTRSGLGQGIRFMIDGEPTDNMLMRGHKGVLALSVRRAGRPGHSAYPEHFDSALHPLIGELNALLALALPVDDNYGTTTVNVGRLEGGKAANVIAESASADIVCRLSRPLSEVEPLVRSVFSPSTTVEVRTASDPAEVYVPLGYPSGIVRFGTDVPHLKPICPVLLAGPGSIHDAHTAHEFLDKAEQKKAVALYVELVEKLKATP